MFWELEPVAVYLPASMIVLRSFFVRGLRLYRRTDRRERRRSCSERGEGRASGPKAESFFDSAEETTIALEGQAAPQWPHLIHDAGLMTLTVLLCISNTVAGQRVRQRPHLVHLRWMTRGGTESGNVLLFCGDAGLAVICLAPLREIAAGWVDDKSGETIAKSRSTSKPAMGFLLFTMQNGNEWYDAQREITYSEGE